MQFVRSARCGVAFVKATLANAGLLGLTLSCAHVAKRSDRLSGHSPAAIMGAADFRTRG